MYNNGLRDFFLLFLCNYFEYALYASFAFLWIIDRMVDIIRKRKLLAEILTDDEFHVHVAVNIHRFQKELQNLKVP